MAGATKKLQDHQRIILVTVFAIITIWITDAAYDAFIAEEGSFRSILLSATGHEPFLRLFMTACFLAYGVILSRILSKRKKIAETLQKHSTAIESSMDGIAIYNSDGNYVFVNQAYALINGYENTEEIVGKSYRQAYDEQELIRMDQVCLPALHKNGRWRGELLAKRKNGSTYIQEASVTLLEDGGRVCIIRDITWRKKSEERLRRSEKFLNMIFDSIRDPFCIIDRELQIIRANDAYAKLKSKSVDDLIGKKCYDVLYNRTATCDDCVVQKTLLSSDPCAKEKNIALHDGTAIWVEIYTYPILDEDGKVSHIIEYTRDITDRKKAEEDRQRLIGKLEHLSRTDGLTGLMNRRALTDSLMYEVDRAKRYSSALSLILCDIDNFKYINDTYGHAAGDRALQNITTLLKAFLRKADMAGRYGGDEFMLILPETTIAGAENLADKLLTVMRESTLEFKAGEKLHLSLSIGVAGLSPDDAHIDALIKRADDAMYASKQAGRNRMSTVKS